MSFSPTNHQTRAAGFTLVEMMVSAGLIGVVGLTAFSVLISTMKLSAQNAVTNLSNYRARQTLDRLGETVRFAQDTPLLIKVDGTTTTGSSDGVLIKNALGGPYVFRNANGQADAEIPSGATSFIVEYAPSTGTPPPGVPPSGADAPKVGDYFSLNLSTQPQLEVLTVGTPSGSPVAKVAITTRTGITETAKPGIYTVSASRYRKEAYIFAQSGSSWSLRRYPVVTAVTNYSSASSYKLMGTGFQKLANQAWFTTVTDNGTQACWLRAVARSSNRPEYAENISKRDTLTTMPVQIKLWNYSAPPPATP